MSDDRPDPGPATEWVLLSYRIPREPSTPRIAVWRRLKRLGVAQLGDGLVALPADSRTREHLEWAAQEVVDAGGVASVWLARPTSLAQERELAATMSAARAAEYIALTTEVDTLLAGASGDRSRTITRLRRTWREVRRRDYFPPPERDAASAALRRLTAEDVERAGAAASSEAARE